MTPIRMYDWEAEIDRYVYGFANDSNGAPVAITYRKQPAPEKFLEKSRLVQGVKVGEPMWTCVLVPVSHLIPIE